jgi:acetyl esterase/lipase
MKTLLSTLTLLYILQSASAQKQIFLYEGKPAGSENWTWEETVSEKNLFNTKVVYNVSRPSITAYVPENPNGTAIVVAPGGAFHTLSIDSEGIDVAKWLNAKGVTAFVLKYRVARSFTDDPVKEIMGKMSNFKTLDEENAPVIPLATQDGMRAVKYIREHASEYKIDPKKLVL